MGIDPGTQVVGVGVLDMFGTSARYVSCSAIRAPRGAAMGDRLLAIHTALERAFEEFRPGAVAIERVFVGKNSASAIAIGEGRGIALLCAARAGAEVFEYPPATVKRAIAGFGAADKDQMASWIARLLGLREKPTPHDAADALAIALTHAHRMDSPRSVAPGGARRRGVLRTL
jgi:crossover junction endodeoxyribonuclease RuvC